MVFWLYLQLVSGILIFAVGEWYFGHDCSCNVGGGVGRCRWADDTVFDCGGCITIAVLDLVYASTPLHWSWTHVLHHSCFA